MTDSSDEHWPRAILHVDMDAFYASVEVKDNPGLGGRPLVVGGRPEERGVVAAASYAARAFGIHSAMPMARAVRLCPDLIIVPPRGERYAEESQAIRLIFESYTPLVEPVALDEAFLDVTGSQRLYGSPADIGQAIQQRIREERNLGSSVGVAGCKFVAKVASDLEKPDGFVVVFPGTEESFLGPLPVSRVWGVGPVTERELTRLGIRTIEDLREIDPRLLTSTLGSSTEHLIELAHGRDESPVVPHAEAKSLSAENTFARDLMALAEMDAELLLLAERLGGRLRDKGLTCRTVSLKVRYDDFRTITRSTTLLEPTSSTERLFGVARDVLRRRVPLTRRAVRLLGIEASHLQEEGIGQLELFPPPGEQEARRVEDTLDHLRRQFGAGAVRRGTLMATTASRRPLRKPRQHRDPRSEEGSDPQ